MHLSSVFDDPIERNDIYGLHAAIVLDPRLSQEELDECLKTALPGCSLNLIQLLLESRARLWIFSFYAALNRADVVQTFQLLQSYGFDINRFEFGRSPLHNALNHEPLLLWLLDHGANPNTWSQPSSRNPVIPCPPICEAAKNPDSHALEILLSYGAELHRDAMFYAIGLRHQHNGTATMQALQDHGADINYVSKWRGTALFQAVRTRQVEKLRFLLERGANPLMRSKTGRNALHWAEGCGKEDMREVMMRFLGEEVEK